MIRIFGGESAVRKAVLAAAQEAEVPVATETGAASGEETWIDLGLPPDDWPAGDALVEAEREHVARIAGRGDGRESGGRAVVRVSWFRAAEDAAAPLLRAAAAAEAAWRSKGLRVRHGVLVGDAGFGSAVRRRVSTSFMVPVPGVHDARLEPLLVADLGRYCVEAAARGTGLADEYDLTCGEMLSGGLLARSFAEHLDLRRWVVPAPAWLESVVAGGYATATFPATAVRHALRALRGDLLPRNSRASTEFSFEPADLREAMAAASGRLYPTRRSRREKFGSWRAPERRGMLGAKGPRRRSR
jgi:hypothetical protein